MARTIHTEEKNHCGYNHDRVVHKGKQTVFAGDFCQIYKESRLDAVSVVKAAHEHNLQRMSHNKMLEI